MPEPETGTPTAEEASIAPENVIYESKAARRKAAWRALGWKNFLALAVACGAVLTLITVVVIQLAGNSKPSPAGDSSPSVESLAITACQTYVLENLKAPATASFVNATVTLPEGKYVVRGEVDAQNGFGALIRSDYYCKLEWRQGYWTLLDIWIS